MEQSIIDLGRASGDSKVRNLAGKERGLSARNELKIDYYDNVEGRVKVLVPEGMYAVTSSFFLGLFSKSAKKFKTKNDFLNHYDFVCSSLMKRQIEHGVNRCFISSDLP